MKIFRKIAFLALLILPVVTSCRHKPNGQDWQNDEDIIVTIGDSVLYRVDVEKRIPSGLERKDSIAMFEALVNSWIETNLLLDYASENIANMSEIEETVERFRRQLIVEEYKRQMKLSARALPEDSIKKWYDSHQETYKLERPLIKGLFVKVPRQTGNAARIETLISSGSDADIDKFESDYLGSVSQYSYFRDEWVDWEVISAMIPARIENPDEFVRENRLFKTEYNGMTYFLQITSYLNSGETMPYDYAKNLISDYLREKVLDREEKKIINQLYKRAEKSGKLQKKKS